jgi:hypothetical protein
VISGGDIGAVYVRQLLRAVRAGRLSTRAIRVVDRDPRCAASSWVGWRDGVEVALEVQEWGAWLRGNLRGLGGGDQIVPYHFAPHLFRDWLVGELQEAGAEVELDGMGSVGVPFERETSEGSRALSYATWLCPPLCIEPALCPHTRGPKDWSLVRDLRERPGDLQGRAVFPCLHFAYGVATVGVAGLLAARDEFLGTLSPAPARLLVATTSHCHALASVLRVRRRAG